VFLSRKRRPAKAWLAPMMRGRRLTICSRSNREATIRITAEVQRPLRLRCVKCFLLICNTDLTRSSKELRIPFCSLAGLSNWIPLRISTNEVITDVSLVI
jgi:hypothetical protein